MRIDPDVHAIATRWSNSPNFTRIIQAVVIAEGNIIKAVQISVPSVHDRAGAIEVLCRSCTHAMADFITTGSGAGTDVLKEFIYFWAARWAPVGVTNDPGGLNKNWPVNVLKLLRTP